MKKKFLSLVLACALTVGSVPYATYADDIVTNDVPQVVTTEGETVTYPAPVAAILHDSAGTWQDGELYTSYGLNCTDESGITEVGIYAEGLRKHTNGKGQEGFWVGFALVAPDGADGFKYCTATSAAPSTESALETKITSDGKSGATFYYDVAQGRTAEVGIQWTKSGSDLGTAQYYSVGMNGVTGYVTEKADTTHRYGVLSTEVYMSAKYDNGFELQGSDTVYELDTTGISPQKNSLVIYTRTTMDDGIDPWDEVTVLKEIKHKAGIKDSGLTGGEASDVTSTGFKTASNAWTFANDMVVYVMDSTTGKFTLGSKSDISNGNFVYIGEADGDGKVKLLIVDEYNEDAPSVSAPALSESTMELLEGEIDVSLALNGIAASDYENITWESSNTSVARVKQGTANNAIITTVNAGTTNIIAKLNGQTYTCVLTVIAADYQYGVVSEIAGEVGNETIKLEGNSKTYSYENQSAKVFKSGDLIKYIVVGDRMLVYTGYDNDIESSFKQAEWKDKYLKIDGVAESLNSNVVVYRLDSNGKFVLGSKADIVDGSYVYAAVKNTVNEVTLLIADEYYHAKPTPAKSITLEKSSLKLAPNEGFELHYTLNPTNSTDNVTWTSSDESVVTVESRDYGWVEAVAEGTAILTATTDSGKTATCKVTVAPHLADFVVTVNGKNTGYDSFAEAVAAMPNGSTLTLNNTVDDIAETVVIKNKAVTITVCDAGAEIYGSIQKVLQVAEGGKLTLVGDGSNPDWGSNFWIWGLDIIMDGEVILDGVINEKPVSVRDGGKLTLKSGVIRNYGNEDENALILKDATVNIQDGEVGSILATGNTTLNIKGGEVKSVTLQSYADGETAKANISGGTVGTVAKAGGAGTETISITGGTFSFDPTDYVPTSGYTITHNGNAGDVDENWTVTKKSSGGGGGGGSSSKKDDTTKKDDAKTDEVKTDEVKTEEKTESTTPAVAPGEATTENISQVFPDTKSDDWYSEAAAYAYNNGLMKGNGDGSFGANDSATRGQIVTILHRLANEPETSTSDFKDIGGSEYFAEGVAWAAELGIVNGYEDGTFGANGNVTREELATILYRFAKSQDKLGDKKGDLSGFADGGAASDWAADALAWAVGNGLLQGNDDGSLNPSGTATRAEIATILMRFCENIAK